jgi:hypothetical protein
MINYDSIYMYTYTTDTLHFIVDMHVNIHNNISYTASHPRASVQ